MAMAVALDADKLARLIKLLGMFGSNFAGERENAGKKAHELITAAGTTWAELLTPKPSQAVAVASGPRTWRVFVEQVLIDHYGALYESELKFLPSLLASGRAPSPAQTAWLIKIARRTGCPLWDGATP
jgi:hypothetical protein